VELLGLAEGVGAGSRGASKSDRFSNHFVLSLIFVASEKFALQIDY